jgi:hypothetical protein
MASKLSNLADNVSILAESTSMMLPSLDCRQWPARRGVVTSAALSTCCISSFGTTVLEASLQ